MLKKLITVIMIVFATALFCTEKYAVLIAGDYNPTNVPADQLWNEGQGDYSEFWNDLYLQWEMLYQKGYAKENIIVIFANSRDMWQDDPSIATRYRAEYNTKVIDETITNYSATKEELGIAVNVLRDKIGPDDFLYVWAMSHGGSPTQSSLYFNDGEMTDTEFAGLFNTVTAYKKHFVISANYAQGFLNKYLYTGDNVRVEVSTKDTSSHRADDKAVKGGAVIPFLENEEINGRIYYHGEFNFHKYMSSMMQTQYGSSTYNGIDLQSVDTHDDDFICFDESYAWTEGKVSDDSVTEYIDIGNLSHVPEGRNTVGYYSSFDYPTHIFNEFYGFDVDFTTPFVKGLCGVTENLEISANYVDATVGLGSNSITNITGNNSIIVNRITEYHDSKLILGNNSVLTGENNNRVELTKSTSDLPNSLIEFFGGKLQNLDILNEGELRIQTSGIIENSKLTQNGIISVPGSSGSGGTLSIDNTEIRTSESVSSVVELGTLTGTTELRSEYVMPKIILSNYTDWEFRGEFQGHWENGLEVTDGSRFYVTDGSSFFKAGINVFNFGEYIYTNNCYFEGSYINIYDNGKFIFESNGIYNLDSYGLPNITASSGGEVTLGEGSTLNIEQTNINLESGSTLKINHGSNLIADYTFPERSKLRTSGDCSISGNITFSPDASMRIGGMTIGNISPETVVTAGTEVTFNQADLYIGPNAKLIIEEGALVQLIGPMKVVVATGSGIDVNGVVQIGDVEWIWGFEEDEPNPRTGDEFWLGLCANSTGRISISNSNFSDVETAISGSPASISVYNCTFSDCNNGIILDACPDVRIIRNTFTGKGTGSAITITQSEGWINNNTVSNFYKGINAISCSPLIVQNTVTDNALNGIYVAGYNTFPVMVNPLKEMTLKSSGEDIGIDDRELNNHVYNNGIDYVPSLPGMISKASQIYMVSNSNLYLDEGMNNIYSDNNTVPCIRTISFIPEGEIPRPILIYAPENYWGYGVNDSFFALSTPYYIDYHDPASSPYGADPFTSTGPQEESKPSKLLSKAIQAELDGKYDKAIKDYEKIIDKYPDSREAEVAYSRLPDNYIEEGLALEPLIAVYDDNIETSDNSVDKKFFKEMKVATHIKGKKYDDAIAISEEMLTEAGTEEEEILCMIDIAIANMLKNSGSKGRNESANRDELNVLYSKLVGTKSEPAGITESVLPETSKLYQNYPNPFNPVTEIKYDLAIDSPVKLSIYNINGQLVSELVNGQRNAGMHTVSFDASNFNSGMYFYTLEANGSTFSKKMILMK